MRGSLLASTVILGWSLACAADPGSPAADTDDEELVGAEPEDGPDTEPRSPEKRGRDRGKRGGRRRGGKSKSPSPAPSPSPSPSPSPAPTEIVCTAVGVYVACQEEGKPKTCKDEEVQAKGPGATRSAAETAAVEACEAHMATMMSFAGAGAGSAEKKTPCAVRACE